MKVDENIRGATCISDAFSQSDFWENISGFLLFL